MMLRLVISKNETAKEVVKNAFFLQISRQFVSQITKQKYCDRFLQRTLTHILRPGEFVQEKFIRYYSSNLPNHVRVTLPALSPTMEMGTIISWQKKEGEKLNEGDLLAEIETDKATMGFETPEEGYLAKILIPAGTKDVPIGKLVCIIVENETDIAAFKEFKGDSGGTPTVTADLPTASVKSSTETPSSPTNVLVSVPTAVPTHALDSATSGSRIYASPMAKRLAEQKNIRLQGKVPIHERDSEISGSRIYASPMAKRLAQQKNIRLQGKGTGLFGAITSSDLNASVDASQLPGPQIGAPALPASVMPQPAAFVPMVTSGVSNAIAAGPALFTDVPVSNMRRTIAKRLLESKQLIPHYYLSAEIRIDTLLELRSNYNKKFEKSTMKLSLNDFIIKAAAVASQKVPEVNSSWIDNTIRQYKNVDVSVAVSTDKGLLTPVIHEANNKGVVQISMVVKELAAKARAGKLQPHEYQGGSISISNLGMFGVDYFSAIINPPQSSILAIGTTVSRLVPDASNEKGFTEAKFLTATLSCDHRVVDGAVGARWLQIFRECLSDPIEMIL